MSRALQVCCQVRADEPRCAEDREARHTSPKPAKSCATDSRRRSRIRRELTPDHGASAYNRTLSKGRTVQSAIDAGLYNIIDPNTAAALLKSLIGHGTNLLICRRKLQLAYDKGAWSFGSR